MMKLSMIQQMIKNEQLKGMGFPNIVPQMMAGMMPTTELMNLKQNMYQQYMRNVPQPQPQPQVVKPNAPIHNLTEAFLSKK